MYGFGRPDAIFRGPGGRGKIHRRKFGLAHTPAFGVGDYSLST